MANCAMAFSRSVVAAAASGLCSYQGVGNVFLSSPSTNQPALKCPALRFLQSIGVPTQVVRRGQRHGSLPRNDQAPLIDVTGNHRKLRQHYSLMIDGGLNSHAGRRKATT